MVYFTKQGSDYLKTYKDDIILKYNKFTNDMY